MNENIDRDEVARFNALAANWWDPAGSMEPLHVINPTRVRYIRRRVGSLDHRRVVDVGCGGGLLTESLAKDGAQVLGIDLATQSIDVARKHADDQRLNVEYRVISAEALSVEHSGTFDLVCCMEMLEHVPDPAAVVSACAQLVAPGGDVIFSTINRNLKSYALMILGAEMTLGLLPRGTHNYGQFIRPSELCEWALGSGLESREIVGLRYNPILRSAAISTSDLDVNYLLHCQRPA